MDSNSFNIKLKRTLIIVFELFLGVSYLVWKLLTSSLNDEFSFRYIISPNSGEPIGLFMCLFLYFLGFLIGGILLSAAIIVITEIPCAILVKGEISKKENKPITNGLGYLGMLIGFSVMAILTLLHVSGIATIDFWI